MMGVRRTEKNRMSLPAKILVWFVGILFILALLAMIYVIAKIFITGDRIHNPLNRDYSHLRNGKVNLKNGDPFTIALFGVDSDAERKAQGGGSRSDTIMILSINPKEKKTEIVSVPRDTQAKMVGKGTTEKIAHAYAYGGPNMAVNSLEKLMNVPIDHYATIDMDGLHDMIDTMGGIDVVSNDTFTTNGVHFEKGKKTHVNGEEAMSFIRSRKEEGAGGDFGRQERQQLILEAMANKMTSASSITHFAPLMNEIQKNVKTDLSLGELNTIRSKYKDANDTVSRHQLDGQGGIQDDGLYYFVPSDSSLQENTNLLKDNLNL